MTRTKQTVKRGSTVPRTGNRYMLNRRMQSSHYKIKKVLKALKTNLILIWVYLVEHMNIYLMNLFYTDNTLITYQMKYSEAPFLDNSFLIQFFYFHLHKPFFNSILWSPGINKMLWEQSKGGQRSVFKNLFQIDGDLS